MGLMWYFANDFRAKCAVNDNNTVRIVANFEASSETKYNTLGSFCRFQLKSLIFLSCFFFFGIRLYFTMVFFFVFDVLQGNVTGWPKVLNSWQSVLKQLSGPTTYKTHIRICDAYITRTWKLSLKRHYVQTGSECECESDAIDIFKSKERKNSCTTAATLRSSLCYLVFFLSLYISLVHNACKCSDSNFVYKISAHVEFKFIHAETKRTFKVWLYQIHWECEPNFNLNHKYKF